MADNTDEPFHPEYSRQLDIESIISAPLVAVSKANILMETGQTRFILEYCFTKDHLSGAYRPIMIDMVMMKGIFEDKTDYTVSPPVKNVEVRQVELKFSIPLLCLVPINSLAINKTTVDFILEITSATSRDSTANISNTLINNQRANLKGRLAADNSNEGGGSGRNQYRSQNSSTLKVHIESSALPLPLGVLAILDLYTKTIQPLPGQ